MDDLCSHASHVHVKPAAYADLHARTTVCTENSSAASTRHIQVDHPSVFCVHEIVRHTVAPCDELLSKVISHSLSVQKLQVLFGPATLCAMR